MKIKKDNKLLLKILSALAAVALWFAITYTEDPIISQYLTDVDIVFEGENTLHANGLIVTNKDELPSIAVTVKGNRSSVISSINTITAAVDVSKITSAGTNSAEVKYNYPSSNIYLAKAKTREINIETEKIVSREIPVKIEQQNSEKSTAMIKSDTQEQFVKVRGAESTVYSIAYAKAVIDAANVTKTSSQEYFYKFYNDKDEAVDVDNIIYKSAETISVDNLVLVKQTLPVKVILPDRMKEDYILSIKSQSIETVAVGVSQEIEPDEFFKNKEIYAYFEESKKRDDGTYELSISVPDGCFVPEDYSTVIVNCDLIPKVEKEVEVAVTIQNVPEGLKVRLEPEKIKVLVKGTEDKLAPSNIKATVDASGISENESKKVEVKFENKEDIKVIGIYSTYVISE